MAEWVLSSARAMMNDSSALDWVGYVSNKWLLFFSCYRLLRAEARHTISAASKTRLLRQASFSFSSRDSGIYQSSRDRS